MSRPIQLVFLSLAIAACDSATDQEIDDTEPAASTTVPPTDMWDEARLIAHSDGVMPKGERLLRFGSPRGEVEALAAKAFGEPAEQSQKDDCGAGPMEFSQYGPLRLAYQDDKLVGWHLVEGKQAMQADGIPVGWPLKALRQERDVRDIDTEPGGEFIYTTSEFGQIAGVAADDPAETITAFSAGMTCSFR